MDDRIPELLDFWFSLSPSQWFMEPPPTLDADIRKRYGSLVEEARTGALDEEWGSTPAGSLGLILLLDQFPRNIYRGSASSFSSDNHAVKITTAAISREFDREMETSHGLYYRYFFYLPLMHAEDLTSQIAALALVENLAHECPADTEEKEFFTNGIEFTKKHRDCIVKMGRFPKRNEWLGRETREDEKKFLKEHPMGF